MRIGALCCFVSLAAVTFGASLSDFRERVSRAESDRAFERILAEAPREAHAKGFLARALRQAEGPGDWRGRRDALSDSLRIYDQGRALGSSRSSAKGFAERALRNPAYRDPGATQNRAVSARWADDLRDRFESWLSSEPAARAPGGPGGADLGFLEPLVWLLLGAGLLTFAVWAFLRFRPGARKARKRGVARDEEVLLSSDQWLRQAAELEAQGRHREAVRCLYLASLRKLDEALVLRFVPAQTNWEHLRRFEALQDRPEGLDLRSLTLCFDRVWYGHQVNGPDDVRVMRLAYESLLKSLRVKAN